MPETPLSTEIAQIAKAAREVAEDAERRQRWNDDTLECAALYAVQTAFESFAHRIEQLSNSPGSTSAQEDA